MRKFIQKLKNMSNDDSTVLKHTMGAFLIKGLALILSLFTMPAYLRFFNNEMALGLWFTILSVLNWMLTFDFGIGNGLRNKLTESLAKQDYVDSKKYISSAYIAITGLVVFIGVVFSIIFNYINWNKVLNIATDIISSKALLITVQITFFGIMLQLVLRLITSILYALQLSSINNFLSLCTSILTLGLVLILPSQSNDKNIIVMAIIHAIAAILPLIFATIIVFFLQRKRNLFPDYRMFSFKHAKEVLSLGVVFLYVQIMYMVIMNTNTYLISLFSSPENVVEYEIYYKIFSLVGTVFTLMLTPIWSSITKAITQKNTPWVKSLYKKLIILSLVGVVCEFLIVPFMQILINLWLGAESISINYYYGLIFAIMGSLMIFNGTFSSVANGIGKLKTQAVCFSLGAILKIALAYILTFKENFWIGVVIANIISLIIYCVIQPIILKKQLNKAEDSSLSNLDIGEEKMSEEIEKGECN